MLSVRGLVSGYGGARVLHGVDLDVARGEVLALLGRNGMGKSTLIRTLMGLLPARAGAVEFDGRRIDGLRPFEISNLGLAYVPQGRELFADFTIEENLLMGVLGKPHLAPRVPDAVLEHFPVLGERLRQRAGTLSGGEQQQLAIARALAGAPAMLLLDEPSEGIQPSIVQRIAETLRRVAGEQGLTVLLVEQNVEMVFDMAARCAFIENGAIAAEADTAVLRADDHPLHRYLSV